MNESKKEREPAKVTDWIQATAALAAAILAGWAGLVALDAFRDQQAINRSQLQLNQLAADRFKQRYASRVAWWTPTRETIVIQNRSPVPLEPVDVWVRVEGPEGQQVWRFDLGMGPCMNATVRLTDISASDPTVYPESLGFGDPVDRWKRDNMGVLTSDPAPTEEISGSLDNVIFKAAEDCGEGG